MQLFSSCSLPFYSFLQLRVFMFHSVSDMTEQCKGKWNKMFTHLYGDQPCKGDLDNMAVWLLRISMFIHFCRDHTCRNERSNVAVCLPFELFGTNWNTDCWLSINTFTPMLSSGDLNALYQPFFSEGMCFHMGRNKPKYLRNYLKNCMKFSGYL
jgi:hypothetical protein